MLDAETLRKYVDYDAETGLFKRRLFLRKGRGGNGSAHHSGYMFLRVLGKRYAIHRLAWLHFFGVWPTFDIDHINSIKTDNRIANLRDAPTQINTQNIRSKTVRNRSGYLGAHWHKREKKWIAAIHIDGKGKRLGAFATAQEAHAVYVAAKRRLHPGCTL